MDPVYNQSFALPQVKRTVLMIGGPLKTRHFKLDLHEVVHTRDLASSIDAISDLRPDLVLYFVKGGQIDLEEHVMTWLIEGFRGRFIVLDTSNRIKDYEILLDSQVVDEYYSGPISPSRFKSIVQSQLTHDLRFASPRAMTTFDLFRNLFDRGLNAIFFFTSDLKKCVAANIRAEQMTGYTLYELRHMGLEDLVHSEHLELTRRTIRRATRQYYDARSIIVLTDRLGRSHVFSFSCGVFGFGRKSFVKIEIQGQTEQAVPSFPKVTDVHELPEELIDSVSFMNALDDNVAVVSQKKENALSLIVCKVGPGKFVERIKDIASEEGQLMKDVAKTLQAVIRKTDFLSRLSHYQFGLLLPKTPQKKAGALVKRLDSRLRKIPLFKEQCYEFELEMAECPVKAYPFVSLLRHAEGRK